MSVLPDRVSYVTPQEVNEWRAAGTAVIVDVREPPEWDVAHIPGAILMPLSTFDPAKIPEVGDKHLVFHCKSGVRCGMASAKAMEAGYKGKIARMEGGMLAWARNGFDIEQGS